MVQEGGDQRNPSEHFGLAQLLFAGRSMLWRFRLLSLLFAKAVGRIKFSFTPLIWTFSELAFVCRVQMLMIKVN